MVRAVLLEVCGTQEEYKGLGLLEGKHSISFSAYDGLIAGQDLFWVQTTLAAMVRMFKRVGSRKNWARPKQWYSHQGSSRANREQRLARGERRMKGPLFGVVIEPGYDTRSVGGE